MHTLRPTMRGLITIYRIGYYDPNPRMDNWRMIAETDDFENALEWVNYLNGGSAKPLKPLNPIS